MDLVWPMNRTGCLLSLRLLILSNWKRNNLLLLNRAGYIQEKKLKNAVFLLKKLNKPKLHKKLCELIFLREKPPTSRRPDAARTSVTKTPLFNE
uniref:Uncharacterized protein n=1 Tax=Romanomermis culicivorax TaxID=13658 RepID=A0A915HPF9_ROMCU